MESGKAEEINTAGLDEKRRDSMDLQYQELACPKSQVDSKTNFSSALHLFDGPHGPLHQQEEDRARTLGPPQQKERRSKFRNAPLDQDHPCNRSSKAMGGGEWSWFEFHIRRLDSFLVQDPTTRFKAHAPGAAFGESSSRDLRFKFFARYRPQPFGSSSP